MEIQSINPFISTSESGTGRNDIVIKNVLTREIAVVLEIKSVDKYEVSLVNEGYKKVIKYGIAFEGKRCMIKKA